MARIDKSNIPPSSQYAESLMSAERSGFNETNDCAVVALSIATGVPYAAVHAAMAAAGRKARKGAYLMQYESAAQALGFRLVPVRIFEVIAKYPGNHKNLRNVTTHHPNRFNDVWADGNNYLFRIRGHLLAVTNGVVQDWTRGRAKRVTGIWRVEKI